MNSRILKTAGISAAVIFMSTSCGNMAIPSSLSVKTDAEYNFTIGTIEKDLSELSSDLKNNLNEKLSTAGSDGVTAKLYDYQPNNTTMQEYLIEYPVSDYSLDLSSYLNDGSNTGFSQSGSYAQSVPKIDQTFSFDETITSTQVMNAVGAPAPTGDITIIEPGALYTETAPATLDKYGKIWIKVVINNISSMTFASGDLTITLTPTGTPSDSFGKIVTASLVDASNNEVSNATSSKVMGNNVISLKIPLSGKTIGKTMQLNFGGSMWGGNMSQSDAYAVTSQFTNAVLAEATGVTVNVDSFTIGDTEGTDLSIAPVVSAIIDTGTLNISSQIPSGWTGVSCSLTPSITGALTAGAGKTFTNASDTSGYLFNKTLDLKNSSLLAGSKIYVSGTAEFSLSNATILFSAGNASFTVNGSCSVQKLSKAVVTVTTQPAYTVNKTLSSLDIASIVNKINNAKFTITGTFINGLPDGNNMSAKMTSTYFSNLSGNMADSYYEITSNGTTATTTTATKDTVTLASDTVDMTANILLPGQTEGSTATATFSNIETNKNYTVDYTFSVAIDWESADVNISAIKSKLTKTGEITNFKDTDFSTYFSSVTSDQDIEGIDSVKIKNLPVYMYVIAPDEIQAMFSSAKAQASLSASYTPNGSTTTTVSALIPDNTEINFVDNAIVLGDTATTVTTDISKTTSSIDLDLADVINSKPKNLVLNYTIAPGTPSASTMTINNPGESKAEISVKLLMVLPMELNLGTDVTFTYDMGSTDSSGTAADLLGRDSGTTDYDKYVNALKRISIYTDVTNNILSGENLTITLSDTASGISKSLTTSSGSQTLTFTADDMNAVLHNYPFAPKVKVSAPKTTTQTIKVLRNPSVKALVGLTIATDGTINIFGGDD